MSDDETVNLHVMELRNEVAVDMCEVQPEIAALLKEAVAITWELVPTETGHKLVAHVNKGFKRGGQVVFYD